MVPRASDRSRKRPRNPTPKLKSVHSVAMFHWLLSYAKVMLAQSHAGTLGPCELHCKHIMNGHVWTWRS